jgi:NADH:ubiquinone oxidoreductase subunit F (NADH-binding)/NAD-dependent dihydropyrimidine dehydrogenase PreA subunit
VNNVETLATVPFIIACGVEAFRSAGTYDNPGTKIFSLVGAIRRPGLVEVDMETSIATLVEKIGAGEGFKAVQVGGPSGVLLPAALKDRALGYQALEEAGGFMGSGGIVVLNEAQCIVETARYFLEFNADESCGTCPSCYEGARACVCLLEELTRGTGSAETLALLKEQAEQVGARSLCSLGKTAARPLISALRYFPQEFEAHVNGRCPSLTCRDLIRFEIDTSRCQGERCCLQTCPGNAIRGGFGKPGKIVERLCTHCWMCTLTCPYEAIVVTSQSLGREVV